MNRGTGRTPGDKNRRFTGTIDRCAAEASTQQDEAMNWQQVKTNWKDISKHFHAKWDKLTEADLKAIAGRRSELLSRLQMHYALNKTQAEEQAEAFVESLH
jgi:uncharacterized protein YjbJ (UPF0337 family)